MYEESNQRKQKFFVSLQNLALILKTRKVDQELQITIKEPKEFTVEYVLDIISKIGRGQESKGRLKLCKDFVRRCHRKVEDNKAVVEGLLGMIPTDIYGSVLSGGFALILAVSEPPSCIMLLPMRRTDLFNLGCRKAL